VYRLVGALGEVLAQESVGVLVSAEMPGCASQKKTLVLSAPVISWKRDVLVPRSYVVYWGRCAGRSAGSSTSASRTVAALCWWKSLTIRVWRSGRAAVRGTDDEVVLPRSGDRPGSGVERSFVNGQAGGLEAVLALVQASVGARVVPTRCAAEGTPVYS